MRRGAEPYGVAAPPLGDPMGSCITAGHGFVKGEPQTVREERGAALHLVAGPWDRGEHPHAARGPAGSSPPSVHSRSPVIHSESAQSPIVPELSPILSTAGENHSRVVPRTRRGAGAPRGRGGPGVRPGAPPHPIGIMSVLTRISATHSTTA